MLHLGVQFN